MLPSIAVMGKISTGRYVYQNDAGEFYDVCLSWDTQIECALMNDDKDEFVHYIDEFHESAKMCQLDSGTDFCT